jgi:hypothetical protein
MRKCGAKLGVREENTHENALRVCAAGLTYDKNGRMVRGRQWETIETPEDLLRFAEQRCMARLRRRCCLRRLGWNWR